MALAAAVGQLLIAVSLIIVAAVLRELTKVLEKFLRLRIRVTVTPHEDGEDYFTESPRHENGPMGTSSSRRRTRRGENRITDRSPTPPFLNRTSGG